MKILVPDFLFSYVQGDACTLLQTCAVVTATRQGDFSGPLDGVEAVMLPWNLPPAARAAVLELPTLRWVQTISAGVEASIVAALRDRDVILTNASGLFDRPIAETVLTYILMALKRMPDYAAQQRDHHWHKLAHREAGDLTVGIVGLGSIGGEVARLCRALGMRVIALRRHPEQGAAHVEALWPPERIDDLLAEADFVVLAVPLTPETQGLIGAAQLHRMKPSAWLINIARGAIVDEAVLIQALQAGTIAGAALDVFTTEPLPPESPLWGLPNVILTPHQSWSTPHLQAREAALFLDNLRRYLSGEPLINVVDKERGY